jgi:predicted phosphodiesterase
MTLLENFENYSVGESYPVLAAGKASASIVGGLGAFGRGKAVKINSPEIEKYSNNRGDGWEYPALHVPVYVTFDQITSSTGLMFYLKGYKNNTENTFNLHLRVKGLVGNQEKTADFFANWDSIPIYDVANGVWDSARSGNNSSFRMVPADFEGYIFVPFELLKDRSSSTNSSINFTAITAIELGFQNVGGSNGFAVLDNIYLIKSSVDKSTDLASLNGSVKKSMMEKDMEPAPDLSRGLIFHASFDDETLRDSTEYENHGVACGHGVDFVDGVIGKALKIYNRDENGNHLWSKPAINYAEFGTEDSFAFNYNNFTIAGWYKVNRAAPVEGIIFTNKDANGNGFYVAVNGERGVFAQIVINGQKIYIPASGNVGGSAVLDQQWHHIAFSVDRKGEAVLYLDGIAIFSVNISGHTGSAGGSFLTIGRDRVSGTGGLDDALVDEVSVWNRALTAEEIAMAKDIIRIELAVRNYQESLAKVNVDGFLYKQEDYDAILAKFNQLVSNLESAGTLQEKKDLIAAFDAEYKKFMAGKPAKFTFAVASDTHIREAGANLDRLIAFLEDVKLASSDVKAVLICGDLTENGTKAEYEKFWYVLANHTPEGTVVLPAIGNHDARGPLSSTDPKEVRWNNAKQWYLNGLNSYLKTNYTTTYYHQVIGGNDFLILGTENAEKDDALISSQQVQWLSSKLKSISEEKPNQPIFVVLHQPLPSTHQGTYSSSSIVDNAGQEIKSLIAKYPQVVFFSGHLHNGAGYSDVINDGKGIFVDIPSMDKNERGNTSITLVYYVSVYDNVIRLQVMDIGTGNWLPEYEVVVPYTGVSPVNKDELRKLYLDYRFMGQGRYSEKTWAAFVEALNNAHAVLKDTSATQSRIDEAAKSLRKAAEGLEVIPLDLAADKPAMELEVLQDFSGYSDGNNIVGKGVEVSSDSMTAVVQKGSSALDGVNGVLLGAETAVGDTQYYRVPVKDGADISKMEGLMFYVRLPRHKSGDVAVRLSLSLGLDSTYVSLANAKLRYLDITSQSWIPITVGSTGFVSMPAGFEGYIKISFSELISSQQTAVRNSSVFDGLQIKCGYIGGQEFGPMLVDAIYGVKKDTGGLTALIGSKGERYLVNGQKPTQDNKDLFKAAMKAETLQSFKGYSAGEDARGRKAVNVSNTNKNAVDDITIKFVKGISGIIPGPALNIDAATLRSFWPGPGAVEEWAYIETMYPANTFIDDMQGLLLYVKMPVANPYDDIDTFNGRLFFNMRTVGADGTEVWSNTGSYEKVYFLEKGSTEWKKLESHSGHVFLPLGKEGYVFAPIESFVVNPIANSMVGRKLVSTTFILSSYGADAGSATIDGIWSVIDKGSNNLLLTYNGAEVWFLPENRLALKKDLELGGPFDDDDDLIDSLPEPTTDKQIHQPDWQDITDRSIKLSWESYSGAASYRVRIYQSVGTNKGMMYQVVAEKVVKGTSVTIEGLQPLHWYYAVVEALDSENNTIAVYQNMLLQTNDVDSSDDIDDTEQPSGPSDGEGAGKGGKNNSGDYDYSDGDETGESPQEEEQLPDENVPGDSDEGSPSDSDNTGKPQDNGSKDKQTDKKDGSPAVWIIIAVAVVIIAGGGITAFLLIRRKRQSRT